MYFSLSIPLSHLQRGEKLSAADISLQGSPEIIKTESHGDDLYVLVGRVYGERETDLKTLASRFEQGVLFQGHYLLLKIEPKTNRVQFWIDKYRLLSVLISVSESSIWLGNCPKFIPAEIREPDLLAEQSLREMGAVPYPRTLFKNLQFITGNGSFNKILKMGEHALSWPKESQAPEIDTWIALFQKGLNDILRNFRPEYFRLSGGTDTRMIAFSIPALFWPSLKVQVLCHPLLEPTEDHDVMGAQMVADLLKVPMQIIRPEADKYNYVGGAPPGEILSGLYGGEFLGGLVHQFSPIKNRHDFPSSAMRDLWDERENSIGERAMQVELFLSTFRSTIYASIKNSWSNPWMLNLYSLSPFVEEALLDAILQTPYEMLMNYRIYDMIFKKLMGEKTALPLTSPITQLQSGFTLFSEGKNPKSLSSNSYSPRELGEKNLEYFLTKYPAVF